MALAKLQKVLSINNLWKIRLCLSITSRQETHLIEFNNIKINSYQFSNNKIDHSILKKLEDANYILISIPPIDGKDIVANYFETNLKIKTNCKWITYLSATSVYGDHKGDWVNENSITKHPHLAG